MNDIEIRTVAIAVAAIGFLVALGDWFAGEDTFPSFNSWIGIAASSAALAYVAGKERHRENEGLLSVFAAGVVISTGGAILFVLGGLPVALLKGILQ